MILISFNTARRFAGCLWLLHSCCRSGNPDHRNRSSCDLVRTRKKLQETPIRKCHVTVFASTVCISRTCSGLTIKGGSDEWIYTEFCSEILFTFLSVLLLHRSPGCGAWGQFSAPAMTVGLGLILHWECSLLQRQGVFYHPCALSTCEMKIQVIAYYCFIVGFAAFICSIIKVIVK